jgi:hypothetical protein
LALLANNKQAEAETGSVRSRAIDESLSRPKHATTQTNSSISLLKMTIAFSQGTYMEHHYIKKKDENCCNRIS